MDPPEPPEVTVAEQVNEGLIIDARYKKLYDTVKLGKNIRESAVMALYQPLLPSVVYPDPKIFSVNVEQTLGRKRPDFTFNIWRNGDDGVASWDTFLVGEAKAPGKTSNADMRNLEDQLSGYLSELAKSKPAQTYVYGIAIVGVKVRAFYQKGDEKMKSLWSQDSISIGKYLDIGDDNEADILLELLQRWIPKWSLDGQPNHEDFLSLHPNL